MVSPPIDVHYKLWQRKNQEKNLDNIKNLLDFFENLNYNLDSQKKATNPAR
jgi:hypothetical protein